jgi:hypothetical protein
MGEGLFYKLKTLIGIEEIEEDDMDEAPAPSSLERKPIDPRSSYLSSSRNESKDMKEQKDNRVLPIQNKAIAPNTASLKWWSSSRKALMNARNLWII